MSVVANLLFITYGGLAHSMPVLVLHLMLLPLNVFRLVEIFRTTRLIRAAQPSDGLPISITAYFKIVEKPADAVLFRRGDPADSVYYLKSGRILLEEINQEMQVGEIFGEVAFFSKSHVRTLTARCISKCEIAAISEAEFTRLFYQDPAFGFFILRLLAERLDDNMARACTDHSDHAQHKPV
ncbi:Crp/Fnr family transcriptional regulator [Yoonia sp.]|uniref:Crp/Fnr family transcriptional regulator n=1 Tax=Yoonia sp. TaxID=2212373 RepID=UPI003F6CC727